MRQAATRSSPPKQSTASPLRCSFCYRFPRTGDDRLMRVRSATRLHDLYEAVEDDEALSVFASTVAELCGARSANVLYIPPADAPFHQISYFPEDYVPVYLERFVAK